MTTERRIASTLVNTRPPEWVRDVEMLDRRELGPWRLIARLLRAGRRADALILLGSVGFDARYADLLAALALGRLRRPPRLVISDATWQVGSGALAKLLDRAAAPSGAGDDRLAFKRLARAVVSAIDGPHVTYCVLSSHERAVFAGQWGVDPARVIFTPFCITLQSHELSTPTSLDGGIFAGGNPMRDYPTLIAAVAGLDVTTVIASSSFDPAQRGALAAQISAGPLPHSDFIAQLARARVVVTPMTPGMQRSAGQQTYLNAMALGKPVIVSDSPGARDHIEDGVTGLIVAPGDVVALRAAIDRVLDPANRQWARELGERARTSVLSRFTLDHYLRSLLAAAQRATPHDPDAWGDDR